MRRVGVVKRRYTATKTGTASYRVVGLKFNRLSQVVSGRRVVRTAARTEMTPDPQISVSGVISADGAYVSYVTETELPGDTNGHDKDVVLLERSSAARSLFTKGSLAHSYTSDVSADGSVVVFEAEGAGLATGEIGDWNVFAGVVR